MVARLLSFYLPQFHPIAENSEWHGEGFTEWTKVRAALPLYEGHTQPVEPHESLGYYSLENSETLHFQAELMKTFGISGQVFYHYWFGGRQILQNPAEMLLKNTDIEMPFAFCWANENWTKRWDGGSGEVLLEQRYSEEDAKNFIEYLIKFFRDPRYIKVNERPLLLVYRTADINILDTYLRVWEEACIEAGLSRPFVLSVKTMDDPRIAQAGVNGEVERPLYNFPELRDVPEISERLINNKHPGYVWEYSDVKDFYLKLNQQSALPIYPTVLAGWDVTPRHGKRGNMLVNSSPELFQEWLEGAIDLVTSTFCEEEQLVFINAWNEWAEGAYLEPDSVFGYRKLESVRNARERFIARKENLEEI